MFKQFEIKTTDNHYICIKLLGEGKFAKVYEAMDIKTKENFAIKVFRKD